MESIRVMQEYAKEEEQFEKLLIEIRRIITPTGAWIAEDAAMGQEDEKRRQKEIEELRAKQEEKRRLELIAEENARKSKIRARKIALGIDPSEGNHCFVFQQRKKTRCGTNNFPFRAITNVS